MSKVTEVVEAVRKLADAKPDFVYMPLYGAGCDTCLYIADSRGSCIIGQAILAVDDSDRAYRLLQLADSTPLGLAADEVMKRLYPKEVSQDKTAWLRAVQSRQDAGGTWAEAVKFADLHYPIT